MSIIADASKLLMSDVLRDNVQFDVDIEESILCHVHSSSIEDIIVGVPIEWRLNTDGSVKIGLRLLMSSALTISEHIRNLQYMCQKLTSL